jgi:hypothetical protein
MSAYEEAIKSVLPKASKTSDKCPAAAKFTLLPQHFADTWEGKPVAPVEIGLRVPPEGEMIGARVEAVRVARDTRGDLTDADRDQIFNDALTSIIVARGICDPNDVRASHPFLQMAEDVVPMALKTRTIRHLFEQLDKLHIEQSPLFLEIDREGLSRLTEYLSIEDPFNGLSDFNRERAARFLQLALELIEE